MSLQQKTLKKEIVAHGKGLFTGVEVVIRLSPLPPGSGVVFRRSDLPTQPTVCGLTENVHEAVRCTKIGQGRESIQTIEHCMAAVRASGIDNLLIEVGGPEMPIFDGSALPFIRMIDESGVVDQEAMKEIYRLERPAVWSEGDMHLIALPAQQLKISYTLHYPKSPYLKSQYYSYTLDPQTFRDEIAPCRTFALVEEIAPLIEKGLLKTANLESGVVIDGMKVLNPEGVRFPDEMVRHKILDMIGDFALLGFTFYAHLIAIKTGHEANHKFAKELRQFLRKQ